MVLRSAFVAAATSIGLMSLPAAASGVPAPRVSIASLDALSVPAYPFDADADADHDVASAFARARGEHKRVLIDLGGNWCGDCRVLAGIMELPEMHAFLTRYFVVVTVDVGRFDKNLQIPARFGVLDSLKGVPCVLIATPDGELVNRRNTEALQDARSMTPQAIADWLAQWAR